jgi:hypothetical protein
VGKRVASPGDQRRHLAEIVGNREIAVSRGADLWPDDADAGWSLLAGAAFTVDASRGSGPGAGGWVAGTGMPYRPLATNGLMHAILEIGAQAAVPLGDLDSGTLTRWLRANGGGARGAIHLVFSRPDDDRSFASLATSTWEQLTEQGRRHGHQVATLEEFADFWESRGRCRMTWDMRGERLRVDIPPYEPSALAPIAIAVPREWRDRSMVGWEATWAPAKHRRSHVFSRTIAVFEVPPSGGAIEVTYRGR